MEATELTRLLDVTRLLTKMKDIEYVRGNLVSTVFAAAILSDTTPFQVLSELEEAMPDVQTWEEFCVPRLTEDS